MMRRTPLILLGALLALGGGLTLAPLPAGAAGHAARVLHAHAMPARADTGSHFTSPVPPLTKGYLETVVLLGDC